MLNEDLTHMLRLVLADPPRVPELARDAEILAAAHQGIGSTALCRGGNTIGREIVLFAASNGDETR